MGKQNVCYLGRGREAATVAARSAESPVRIARVGAAKNEDATGDPTRRRLQAIWRYGDICALDGVTLEIGGGITGLLGPNGAGKSTLIKALLGLVETTEGIGEVLEFQLGRDTQEIRQRVGYMPEDDCYIPGLTGVEMLKFMVRLSGHPAIEGIRRSHEILDYCGAGQERYRDVATYSAGMRQKLKFAQAIVHDPPLLILDEPTAGLDPDEREAMLGSIRSLSTDIGKTVLISTHILPDVQAICDQVVIMVQGRIRVVERLEVLNRPQHPALQVRTVGESRALMARIQESGFPVELSESGTLTIQGLEPAEADRVWRWADELGIGIRWLAPAKHSLEAVFLAALEETGVADS